VVVGVVVVVVVVVFFFFFFAWGFAGAPLSHPRGAGCFYPPHVELPSRSLGCWRVRGGGGWSRSTWCPKRVGRRRGGPVQRGLWRAYGGPGAGRQPASLRSVGSTGAALEQHKTLSPDEKGSERRRRRAYERQKNKKEMRITGRYGQQGAEHKGRGKGRNGRKMVVVVRNGSH
jgi:hypothetical protein